MHTRSIFIASIVYLSFILVVSTENYPRIGDCDIDSIHNGGPIILTFINNLPVYVGSFSFPNQLICKIGKYHMKFINSANIRTAKYNIHHLIAPYSGVTAKEMKILALPANLNRIDVSHNSIGCIFYGMYG